HEGHKRRMLMADRQEEPAREDWAGPDEGELSSRERMSRLRTKVVAPIKAAVALKVAGDDSVTRADVEDEGPNDGDGQT
ncbi:MAG: hypothetical protein ACRDI3_04055, partial [Actinomycetota bacterium]